MANEVKQEKKKGVVKDFLITTLNGMAIGLFATLIIGTIINTIGTFFNSGEDASKFANLMHNVLCNGATALQYLTGAGIGVGVALAMKFNPLQTIVVAVVGELAAYFSLSTKFVTDNIVNWGKFQIGDPLTIYLVVICCFINEISIKKENTCRYPLSPIIWSYCWSYCKCCY